MGFWGRFRKPKAKLTLKTDKDELVLGEDAKGVVELKSEDVFDIEELKVGLSCRESIRKTRIVSKEDDEGNEECYEENYWDSVLLSNDSGVLCNEMPIFVGFSKEFPFTIQLQSIARETYVGADRHLLYTLWATMKVKGRRSIQAERQITVVKPSATQKEVIREVVLIPCSYCGGLIPQTSLFCPNCGARRKA